MKHILLYFLITFPWICSLSAQTSSLLWKVTSPDGQHTSYLLGASNEPDTRGMVMPEGIEGLIASCEIFYTAEDLFIQNIVNKTYKSFPEYWAEQTRIKYQPDFNKLMRAFQSRFGLDSERFYHDRTLLSNVARTGRSYAYGYTPPVEQIAAFAMTLGLPVEGVDPDLLSNPTMDIPEDLWAEYFSWIIDERNSNQANSEYYNALRSGNLGYLSAWKSNATSVDYLIRTRRLAHEFHGQTKRLCERLPDIANTSAAFFVLQPEHLSGEDGVLYALEQSGFVLELLPKKLVPLDLSSGSRSFDPEWQPLQINDLPFSLEVPGNMSTSTHNTAIIPGTALTYHHLELTPYGGATFSIIRLPKPILSEEEHINNLQLLGQDIAVRIGNTRYPMELMPISEQHEYHRPILEFSGFNFNIAVAEKSLREAGVLNISPDQFQQNGPKEIIRAFYTKFEYVILYASNLMDQQRIEVAEQIIESIEFMPLEEEKLLYQKPTQGYSILLPYPYQEAKTSLSLGKHPVPMELHVVSSAKNKTMLAFEVASGILPKNIIIPNDKGELSTYLFNLNSKFKELGATMGKVQKEYRDSCAITRVTFTIQTSAYFPPGTKGEITHTVKGGRTYTMTTYDTGEDKDILTECANSFSFTPFPIPELRTFTDAQDRYSLRLPEKLEYLPSPPPTEGLEELLLKKHDIYSSQDTFSGNNFAITSSAYNDFFQWDSTQLDSLGYLLFIQFWPEEDASFTILSDSSYARDGLTFYEFLIHPTATHNHVRMLAMFNGEWVHSVCLTAPQSLLTQDWIDEVFDSFKPTTLQASEIFQDKSELIIETINSGTEEEIFEALVVLQTCFLPETSADNYFRFLRDSPPFTHPNQALIFQALLQTVSYWKPDSIAKLSQSLFDRTFDPELQAIILEALSTLSFPGFTETFMYGLKRINWDSFEGLIPPLYSFLELTLDTVSGPSVWKYLPDLMIYDFWSIPIATYLPAAVDLGIVGDEEVKIITSHMFSSVQDLWQEIENGISSPTERTETESILAICLHAMSVLPPDKQLRKIFKKIKKTDTSPFLTAQVIYNEIAWGHSLDISAIEEYLSGLRYRKKMLTILAYTDQLELIDKQLYSAAAVAEADIHVVLTDGFVDNSLHQIEEVTSWIDEFGIRFVFQVQVFPEDPIFFILSPAYGEDVMNPTIPSDSFLYFEPEEDVDKKALSDIFHKLAQ